MSDMIDVLAFWQRTSRNGGTYYTTSMSLHDLKLSLNKVFAGIDNDQRVSLNIFKNANKKTEKHPDIRLVMSVWGRREEAPATPAPTPPPEDEVPF